MLGRFFQSNPPATHIVNPSTQSNVNSQDCEQHLDAYTNFVDGMTTDFDSEDDANNFYDPTVASPKITMNNELSHTLSSNSSSSANESRTNLPAYSAPTRKPTKEFTFPQKPSAAASHRRRGGFPVLPPRYSVSTTTPERYPGVQFSGQEYSPTKSSKRKVAKKGEAMKERTDAVGNVNNQNEEEDYESEQDELQIDERDSEQEDVGSNNLVQDSEEEEEEEDESIQTLSRAPKKAVEQQTILQQSYNEAQRQLTLAQKKLDKKKKQLLQSMENPKSPSKPPIPEKTILGANKRKKDYSSPTLSKAKSKPSVHPSKLKSPSFLVPLLTPGTQQEYVDRAIQFVEMYRKQLARLENSPMYRFLLAVKGEANLPMESLVSNWRTAIVRKQRIVSMSNIMLMARALHYMEKDYSPQTTDEFNMGSEARFSEEEQDSIGQIEKGGVKQKDKDFLTSKRNMGRADPPSTPTNNGVSGIKYEQSDTSSPIMNAPDDDDINGPTVQPRFMPQKTHQHLPYDVYQEVRDYMVELRQYAQQLYMRNAAVDVVRELLSAQQSGELETTGTFNAAAQQALLRAGQCNPILQNASLDSYLADGNAMSLMAQLVGHLITRSGTLTPRRDTKMVQLPAINAAAQSVLAQMMYLNWDWDSATNSQVLRFDYRKWHGRRQEQETIINNAIGTTGMGVMFEYMAGGQRGGGYASGGASSGYLPPSYSTYV
jgi:hypothetical protein